MPVQPRQQKRNLSNCVLFMTDEWTHINGLGGKSCKQSILYDKQKGLHTRQAQCTSIVNFGTVEKETWICKTWIAQIRDEPGKYF